MQSSHTTTVVFDEPNLVSCAGLAPALNLAQRAGLHQLCQDRVQIPGPGGAHPQVKIPALIAGMVAGADCIDDMDLLRHGAMAKLFTGTRSPSTLGTFLRSFSGGDVASVGAIASRFLAGLTTLVPGLRAGSDRRAYLDIDDTVKQTYGHTTQGAAVGYTNVWGLNTQLATISTPEVAPLILGARLRSGNRSNGEGSGWYFPRLLATARRAGFTDGLMLRADSGYYGRDLVLAARRAGVRFSIGAKQNAGIKAAIASIDPAAWVPIRYPGAIWDETQHCWISQAQIAEIPYTAFTNGPTRQHVTARLIVRRVAAHNPHAQHGQDELVTPWRYHAIFTDSELPLVAAEAEHRGHAIIEQVIADLKDGPLAHLPSAKFPANATWTLLATMAFNLTRALGATASPTHARARGATIRAQLITIPARIASSARKLTLHLPTRWPWATAWQTMNTGCHGPPTPA